MNYTKIKNCKQYDINCKYYVKIYFNGTYWDLTHVLLLVCMTS